MHHGCRIKKPVEIIIHKKQDVILAAQIIKGCIPPLQGKVANLQYRIFFFHEMLVYECNHLDMLLYFFRMGNSVSIGKASTVRSFFPFMVSAINKELSIASSVASIAAINKGDMASFNNTFASCNLLVPSCGTRTVESVEKAMT